MKLPPGLAMRIAFALGSAPAPHEHPQGLLARLRPHRAKFLAEAARILAIPAPVGILARLESGLRATLPNAFATKPPAKPVAAPQASQAMTTPPKWTTPPRASLAPPATPAQKDTRMTRKEFDQLTPKARGEYMRGGGRLKD